MHRSGTSTISRAINLLGAYLGEEKDLYGPAPDNPEGYWERKEFVDFHDALLGKLKRRWDTTVPLNHEWHLAPELRSERAELASMIKKAFSDKALWAWKDPRTCIMLDLWKYVLAELEMSLSIVFVVRNPMDVAISLKKRNGFSLEKSFGIWLNYNISALHHLRGTKTIFVSYDGFLADGERELERCAESLGIEWPTDDTDLMELLRSFLRPDLRHSVSDITDLRDAPPQVVTLYKLLLQAVDTPSSVGPVFFDQITEMYSQFSSYSIFYQSDICRLFELDKEVSDLRTFKSDTACKLELLREQIADFEIETARLNEQIKSNQVELIQKCGDLVLKEQQLEDLRLKVSELSDKNCDLKQKIEERDTQISEGKRWLANCEKALFDRDQLLLEKDAIVNELITSYSWKITAPFRWCLSHFISKKTT